MRNVIVFLLLLTCPTVFAHDRPSFDPFFLDKTMRVDYYHTGTKGQEMFALDEVYEEGPWPGSKVNLIDTLNLGEYLLRVYDVATNLLIYSRGYSTIFNEWQTTAEAAKGVYHTFSETVRLPYPKRTVQLTISRRDRQMTFDELYRLVIDPSSATTVNRETKPRPYKVVPLMQSGPSEKKVDLLILGDGYTKAEMEKFRRDAKHFNDALFGTSPFKDHKNDFNVWTIEVESKDSGIDIPDKNIWRNTPLGTSYNIFGTPRYVLTEENKALRDIAAAAPYDFINILVNDNRYGGGGIYNLFSTTYTKTDAPGMEWQMDYVYVHEFGHSFGGLGDEYYTSQVAYSEFYPAGVEPWEPNITALLDPKQLKWKRLVSAGTPIPTPWESVQYDSIGALRRKLDRLAPDYYEKREPYHVAQAKLLLTSKYARKVGAFEGAGYSAKGLYRPAVDCRMFSLSLPDFDPVCRAAIKRVIDFYAR
ncbi:MAG: M64 family metallopeptidase [Bacteroidota bacterium]